MPSQNEPNDAPGVPVADSALPRGLRNQIAQVIHPEAWSVTPSAYGLKTQAELEKRTLCGPMRAIARKKADTIIAMVRSAT